MQALFSETYADYYPSSYNNLVSLVLPLLHFSDRETEAQRP